MYLDVLRVKHTELWFKKCPGNLMTVLPFYTGIIVYELRWFTLPQDPDAGKDWGQKEKGETEDEMVGWASSSQWHEFERTLGDGEGLGSLACCSSWGCKESDRLSNCTITTSLSQEDRSVLDTHACICSKNGLLCVVCFCVSVSENTCFCLCLRWRMCRSEEPEAHKDSDLSKITADYSYKNKTRTQTPHITLKSITHWREEKKKARKSLFVFFSSSQWIRSKKVNPELAI